MVSQKPSKLLFGVRIPVDAPIKEMIMKNTIVALHMDFGDDEPKFTEEQNLLLNMMAGLKKKDLSDDEKILFAQMMEDDESNN